MLLFIVEAAAAAAAVAAAAVAVTDAEGDAVDVCCVGDSWVEDCSCMAGAETGAATGADGTATVEELLSWCSDIAKKNSCLVPFLGAAEYGKTGQKMSLERIVEGQETKIPKKDQIGDSTTIKGMKQ